MLCKTYFEHGQGPISINFITRRMLKITFLLQVEVQKLVSTGNNVFKKDNEVQYPEEINELHSK